MIDKFSDTPNFQAQMNQVKLSERTIQELKLLAFEYVKQIVARAHELSQNAPVTGSPTVADQLDGQVSANKINTSQQGFSELIDPTSKERICEAAVQINKQFRLANDPSSKGRGEGTGKLKSVTYQQNPVNSKTAYTQISFGTKKCFTTTSTMTASAAAAAMASNNNPIIRREFIEQDYATMSSSQEESDPRGAHEASRACTGANQPGGRFKGLHQRLNWHLFVSCFSICLPETLAPHTTSSSRSNTGPSAV